MQTPLMAQYYKVKESHPDTLLLFRIGDFYETFDEDAKTASRVLGITLTRRANGGAGDVPLAGFPHHAVDTYLPKLVRAGLRVAICEQLENPKMVKGIVKRDVVEVVTPGVAFSDKLLDHKKSNFLMAVCIRDNIAGISFCDISTAEFHLYQVPSDNLRQQLELISPAEVLIPKKDKDFFISTVSAFNPTVRISKMDDWLFNYDYAAELLENHFRTVNLKGFGIDRYPIGVIAAGVVLTYLRETQKSNISHINKISLYNASDYMILDFATKRNLEIIYSMQDGGREGSLISILDKTQTPMGARLLKRWISAPLIKPEPILRRQESVDAFFQDSQIRKKLILEFKEISDLERLTSKICTGRANPRDVVNLKLSLAKIPRLKELLAGFTSGTLSDLNNKLKPLDSVVAKINNALVESPPLSLSDGGVIKPGYSPELDEIRNISVNGKDWIANLQRQERERTGISSLKVSYNKVFGYYIDISNANKDKIPESYIRKQTLVNSERFITPELKEYEEKILNAEERIYNLESDLFNDLRMFIVSSTEEIQENAKLIAMLDCFLSLSETAAQYGYVKPLIDGSTVLNISDGRHPVVERILPPGENFTPNSCSLDTQESQIIILTGPNMAGKSVFLRQVGLIVLLAQIGSFVPAKEARIGVVDRIFTRVGASDNITAGESTFLVEMQEAANILNNATSRSLILLDEIGRGTSTFDGISIAWATTEYLHENPDICAKTLFATHYHELNEMADIFPRIKNFKVDVREYEDKVIFLHKVISGQADHSYGIQVAQLAGLPDVITDRAKEILANLESKELTPYEVKKAKIAKRKADELQFNLFEVRDDKLRAELKDLAIDNLTPLEALNKLNELKKKVE